MIHNKDGYFCEKCGDKLEYNEEYDSYYCTHCNEWSETQCGDPNCEFCKNRPKRPL